MMRSSTDGTLLRHGAPRGRGIRCGRPWLEHRAVALAPRPVIVTAPPRDGVTGLESFFWLASRPQAIAATASAGGYTVTARAAVDRYEWDFGDGAELTTRDPGRPWTSSHEGSISHLYETKRTYHLRVTVVWRAEWSLDGGGWQPLGTFATEGSRRYPVQEVTTALVQG